MRYLIFAFLLPLFLYADGPGVITSRQSPRDAALSADPNSAFWRGIPAVIADKDRYGKPVPGHRTEIRSRWTAGNVYFLFVCPYESLYLKPNPVTREETNKLWEWDVAEVFIGSDFQNIKRYKEFQVSPQGEWVDLDIDRSNLTPQTGWLWNSGIEVKARIDEKRKIWYGEMRIPFDKIDTRKPAPGNELRINLFRIQGPGPDRKHIAWQAPNNQSYHTPEAFGRIRLE